MNVGALQAAFARCIPLDIKETREFLQTYGDALRVFFNRNEGAMRPDEFLGHITSRLSQSALDDMTGQLLDP